MSNSDSDSSGAPLAAPAGGSQTHNITYTNASDRILDWARRKVNEGEPLNEFELLGLSEVLKERRRQAEGE